MATPRPTEDRGKTVLTTTAEFIKYSAALATGALVFSAGFVGDKLPTSTAARIWLGLSWAALAVSVVGGIFAYSRIPPKLASEDYDLEDPLLTWPARIQQFTFFIGVFCLGVALVLMLTAGPVHRGQEGPTTQLADAINGLERALRDAIPAATSSPLVVPLTALAFAGLAGGLLLAGFSSRGGIRWAGVGLAAMSLAGGGVTIFKFRDVKLPEIKPAFHIQVAGSAASFDHVGYVGPFVTGKPDKLEPIALAAGDPIENIAKKIAVADKNSGVLFFLVIGSADKFELLPALQAEFGSNNGLARARADWVQDRLSKAVKLSPAPQYLPLTVGPTKHGSKLAPHESAVDRGVTVYAARRESSTLKRLSEQLLHRQEQSGPSATERGSDGSGGGESNLGGKFAEPESGVSTSKY